MAKKDGEATAKKPNRYSAIIGTIFRTHYRPGKTQFEFSRDEFFEIAKSLKIALPKNLGDTIYSFRFRTVLPDDILETAGKDREWIIPQSAGKGFGAAGSAAIQAIKGETNGCLQRNSEVWVRNP